MSGNFQVNIFCENLAQDLEDTEIWIENIWIERDRETQRERQRQREKERESEREYTTQHNSTKDSRKHSRQKTFVAIVIC